MSPTVPTNKYSQEETKSRAQCKKNKIWLLSPLARYSRFCSTEKHAGLPGNLNCIVFQSEMNDNSFILYFCDFFDVNKDYFYKFCCYFDSTYLVTLFRKYLEYRGKH